MMTAMHYPCNYGYIPHTLSDDGDPVDVLVTTPVPVTVGAVIRCRPIGILKMDDEAGGDAKLLAGPGHEVLPIYKHGNKPEDLQPERLLQIQHFFQHYKDLEPGKWVKVVGWGGPEEARAEIMAGCRATSRPGRSRSSRRTVAIKLSFPAGQGRGTLCAVTVTRSP